MHHRTLTGQTLSSGTIGLRSGVYDGKIAGLYDLEETLGRGHFAVVKLARHVFTGEKVAVKVIDKTKLDEVSKAHLFQEVRCMKLVQHPNVVRLYEVIDTATKLYLILELGDGGDLYDYIMRHDSGLSEQLAREYFRQIVRAISYCHQLHVVHRDLKPENVVFFEKLGVVKLTDFGFSNKFCPGQKLETSCGSLAYSAPEILLGDSYDAPAVDVWSLGVILYMLVCGQAPFQEANDSETLTMIMDCKYSIPSHVSKECRDLISRMLVRAPEKRATLSEIAAHPWLSLSKNDPHFDVLPLVSKEQLSDDDHNLIVQKIVNGNIATKEEIQECLDKNEYNHITATYFLLAERKLRSKRQEQVNKNRRPEHLNVPQIQVAPARDVTGPTPCLLSIPRTPGDLPQRSRKCSIVQEDEEEEDISSSGREELTPNHCSLNRRGSRSEGRLNLALQERLAEERRKQPERAEIQKHVPSKLAKIRNSEDTRPKSAKENVRGAGDDNNCKVKSKSSTPETTPKSLVQAKILKDMKPLENVTTTTVITGSSTITIPVVTNSTSNINQGLPKFKTMPSPTKTSVASPLQLNEIFEEGDSEMSRPTSRQFVSRNQNRTLYEQRRSKFHKNRTASCSSSDASDDDSENRKKRANKLSAPAKPLPGRRDSHDDSSDSQEPGTGTGTSGSNGQQITTVITQNTSNTVQNTQKSSNNSNSNNTGGRKNCNVIIGRRHKSSRRRTGETRLRESQSLNRITEVQEDASHAIIISTTITANQSTVVPKVKGFGSKLLQNLSINVKRSELKEHQSRKDCLIKSLCLEEEEDCKDEKEYFSKLVTEKSTTKKIRLLGKYFHMHKKLCIPLPGIFNRNRLYKAQSCSSLARDKINVPRQRNVSVVGIGDVNQNRNDEKSQKSTVVQLNNVCNELTGICAIHLGQASKCCAFC